MLKIIRLSVVLMFLSTGMLAQESVTVTAVKENLRGTPDVKGKVVSTVKQDEHLELILVRGKWCLVQAKDFVGWIEASSLSNNRVENLSSGIGSGGGQGSGRGTGSYGQKESQGVTTSSITKPIRILTKPRAAYTDEAKKNGVQGTVILRVTFLASGQIGSISAVRGLPFGLTEQAIAAARQMRFEPAEADGVPVSVTRTIQYTFVPF